MNALKQYVNPQNRDIYCSKEKDYIPETLTSTWQERQTLRLNYINECMPDTHRDPAGPFLLRNLLRKFGLA